jgi:hypothetical protein
LYLIQLQFRANIGSGTGDLVLTVASLENNDASNMFLMNNQTNIVQMSMKGLTGTPLLVVQVKLLLFH